MADPVPVLGTNFVIKFDGLDPFPLLSFSLAGLEATKIEEFAVDPKGAMYKRVAVGRPKNVEVTLSRAFVAGDKGAMELYNWHKTAFTAGYEKAIRDGSIKGYDTSDTLRIEFTFTNAWPKSYKWPALDAKGGSFLTEEITISCDSWRRET
jgi:phage tail-like protein